MKALSIKHLVVWSFLIFALAIVSAAQDSDRFIGSSGPLDIYVTEVLCCVPMHASILEEKLDRGSTVYYRFRNIGDKPVVGIAVTFSNGEWTRLHFSAFVRRDAAVGPWVRQGFAGKAGEELTVAIDFLLFADGTTWGPDKFGRGVYLNDFKRGYDLALDRVLEEAGGTPNAQIDKLLETTFGYKSAIDLSPNGLEPRSSRTPLAIGYDGVVVNLGRGDEAASAIAGKVRTMPIE